MTLSSPTSPFPTKTTTMMMKEVEFHCECELSLCVMTSLARWRCYVGSGRNDVEFYILKHFLFNPQIFLHLDLVLMGLDFDLGWISHLKNDFMFD